MSDYSKLKRLADAAISPDSLEPIVVFRHYATPSVILALIAENERYRQHGCDTCDGSGHLSRADGEYFGACTSCGAYELEQAKRERDQLKADNEALRKVANEFRRFATCEHMHHDKPDWHEYDEPCKVLARIDAVLGGGGKSGD